MTERFTSVILPVKNGERSLVAAIESVLPAELDTAQATQDKGSLI